MSSFATRVARGLYGPNAGSVRAKRGIKPDANKSNKKNFMTLHPTKGWRVIRWARIRLGFGRYK